MEQDERTVYDEAAVVGLPALLIELPEYLERPVVRGVIGRGARR